MPVTVRPSLAVAVIAIVKRPFGRLVRSTGAVIRVRRTVFTRLPLTITTALTNVTPGNLRIRIVNLRRLTDRLNVGVSVGGMFDRVEDFTRVIDAGGIESVRIDPMRLGGLTPARKVALAAELKQVAIYPVRVAEIGTHLSAGCVLGRMCEHVDWFAGVFAGGPRFNNGQLYVSDAPGLGLTVKDDVSQWRL